jgi:hypothetical protein
LWIDWIIHDIFSFRAAETNHLEINGLSTAIGKNAIFSLEARLGFTPTPAKAPPLTRIIHVPPCTADLSPQTRVRAFFLLYVEGVVYTSDFCAGDLLHCRTVNLLEDLGQEFAIVLRLKLAHDIRYGNPFPPLVMLTKNVDFVPVLLLNVYFSLMTLTKEKTDLQQKIPSCLIRLQKNLRLLRLLIPGSASLIIRVPVPAHAVKGTCYLVAIDTGNCQAV